MDKYHLFETILSGEICTLYQKMTGHSLTLSDCRFLNDEQIVLIFEETRTPIEDLLWNSGFSDLAQLIRFHIDQIFQDQLNELIERMTQRSVIDILSESKLTTNRTGMILILGPRYDSHC